MSQEQDEQRPPLDVFHHHEVLHTALIVAGLFEEHIAEHRYTRADPERRVEADRVSAMLWDFYQRLGRGIRGSKPALDDPPAG